MAGRRHYTTEEIEAGLIALAVCAGNSSEASKLLNANGNTPISDRTLRKWKDEQHRERYNEIAKDHRDKIASVLVDDLTATAKAGNRAALAAIAVEEQRIANGDVRDASASARNLATAAAISLDKARILQDRPDRIVEHRSADEILRAIEQKLGRKPQAVDSTAEEMRPGELEAAT